MKSFALVLSSAAMLSSLPLSFARIGDGWGVNIHWTSGQPGEAAMLSSAYRMARMDFDWGRVESQCGVYDFSAYDGLLAEMQAVGVRNYWILDYSNP